MIEMEALRSESAGDLAKRARLLKDELFKARFQHATQQLKDPNTLRHMRRDIARVKTALTEKTRGIVAKAKGEHKAPKAKAEHKAHAAHDHADHAGHDHAEHKTEKKAAAKKAPAKKAAATKPAAKKKG
jgi:large subunit ribosomal protein L29